MHEDSDTGRRLAVTHIGDHVLYELEDSVLYEGFAGECTSGLVRRGRHCSIYTWELFTLSASRTTIKRTSPDMMLPLEARLIGDLVGEGLSCIPSLCRTQSM